MSLWSAHQLIVDCTARWYPERFSLRVGIGGFIWIKGKQCGQVILPADLIGISPWGWRVRWR
ncbi:MAG: hypothetical protein ACOYOS_08030 [Syntrophales bacterium]